MKLLMLSLLSLTLLSSCDSCGGGAGDKEPPVLSCEDACEQQAMARFDYDYCVTSCVSYLPEDTRTEKERHGHCIDHCTQSEESMRQLSTMHCGFQCQQDPDRDGVLGSEDLCPSTLPLRSIIASDGCPDTDGDGYSDRIDKCPQEGSAESVDPHGCPVTSTSCTSDYCAGDSEPRCGVELDCEKQLEIPVTKRIPAAKRMAIARQLLSLRPHPKNCPTAQGGVPTPVMYKPAIGVTPVEAGATAAAGMTVDRILGLLYFKRDGDTLVPLEQDKTATNSTPDRGAYQEFDVEVHFSTVSAPCPVPADGYSLYVEYYYCDHIPGVQEMGHLQELGFCRWHPLDYVSGLQGGQPFFYTVKIAQLIAKLYSPHISHADIAAKFQGNKIGFNYKKLWLRFQAVAHDGNGQSSAVGVHQDAAYIVLYMAGFNKAYELVKIPGEASH